VLTKAEDTGNSATREAAPRGTEEGKETSRGTEEGKESGESGGSVAEPLTNAAFRSVLQKVFASWLGARFLLPVQNDVRRRAEEYLRAFLEAEQQMFQDTRVRALEVPLEAAVDIPGVVLHGRIDRVSERAGRYIVVDYKTHLWKKAAGMVTLDGELYSFQIPIYLLLVERAYGPVAEALYYDIHAGAYYNVFGGGKPWFSDEKREDLLRQTAEAIARMHRDVTGGHFETPSPKGGCVPCEFRPVCREKYRLG